MPLSRPTVLKPRLGTRAIGLVLGALLVMLSCGREVTGPDAVRLSRVLAIQPEFQGAAGQPAVASGVEFARVRLTLERLSGGIALDRTIDFPANADSVPLALSVELSAGSPAAGEQMTIRLRFITAGGDTVFRSGPDTLLVEPARAGAPPTPVVVRPVYVGPGAQAARVELFPSSASGQGGSPLTFTAQAFDGQGALVSDAPILFTSTDTAFVRFADARAGAATTGLRQGSVTVIASLLTGPADSSVVSLTLPAASIAAAGGSGQNGPAGSTLSAPVLVRVAAIDATPVAGATVTFLANNGGSVGAAAVVSDANGIASTSWTLGPAAGAQTLTATATGLSGSPVTFTATAASSGATQLAFTAVPTAGVAGAALSTVTVEARDGQGNLATTFTGVVAIALGANPGNSTLSGTLTANAVSGIASFSGLSLERAAAGYTLAATSTGLVTATSSAFAISAGAATTLVFGSQPASAMIGTTLTPAVQVVARDAFANTATGFTGAVTVALGTNPGGATLGGTLTVNAVAGIATFPTLTVDVTGVGYTLVANAVGLTSATSLPFNTTVAVLAWVNASGGNWSVPANWSLGRVPTEIDSVVIDLAGTYTVNLDTTFTGTFITVGGASGGQTLALTSRTLTIVGELVTQGTGTIAVTSATVAGGGILRNAGALSLRGATIAATLFNEGTLSANSSNTITGALSTAPSSMIRMQSDGTTGFAGITVANGFSNLGVIELTSVGSTYTSTIDVANGTLFNAAGGTIRSLTGTGGARSLGAAVDNQGLMTIAQPLTWGRASAVHTNNGTVDVSADLTLNQSGAGAVLTNTGTITVAAGRTFLTNGGTFVQNAGTVDGTGTLGFSSATATFTTNFSNATLTLTLTNTTVNGPGTLTNSAGRTLSLRGTTIAAPFVNEGTLLVNGSNAISGALTTLASSVITLQSDGSTGFAGITVANGFTNLGVIELTAVGSTYTSVFDVSNGTLLNAAGGTIRSLVGTGGARALGAAVDNQGLMTIAQPLTWGRSGAVHANSGTLDVSADLTLNQSGAAASFTNTGTVTIAAGRTFLTNGGTFVQNAGTVDGTGTLGFSSATANFTTSFSNAAQALTLVNTTVNGPGTLTNSAGRTLSLRGTTIAAPFVNEGTLLVNGSNSITGALTTLASSVITMQSDGSTGFAGVTIANGFTNLGVIELTSIGSTYTSTFDVTNGTLLNAAGATIRSLVGAGGARSLAAAVDNQGLMTIAQPLTWGRTNAVHTNSGTMDVAANLSLNQSGVGASFTNTGTATIAAGQTFLTTGGPFAQSAGTIGGTGTLGFSSATANFTTNFTNASLSLTLLNTTVNGPGTVTNSVGRTLSLRGTTIAAPFVNEGTLLVNGSNSITGALTTLASSVITMQSDGSTGFAGVTIANGFTNLGVIELTSIGSTYTSTFDVTNGTLLNAAGAAIRSLVGAGGARSLAAAVDNQGLLTIAQPLTWGRSGAVHTNSGTLDVSADLTLNQSGAGARFTNTGAIAIATGRVFTTNGGVFSHGAGTIDGAGALAINSATAEFTTDYSNGTLDVSLLNSTVNGPSTLTNAAGRTLTVRGTTIAAPLVNAGTLLADGSNAITGAFTTVTGSTLRLLPTGSTGNSTLTFATGFTNLGAIELTSSVSTYSSQLNVSTGTLVNATGGTISSLPGTGGPRTLGGAVDNQGLITIAQPLTWNGVSAATTNSGTLDVSGGNLALNQSGAGAGFTNTGAVSIATGRAFTVTGGAFAQDGGAFTGPGDLVLVSTTVTGPGTLVNPAGRTLTLRGTTIAAPFLNDGTLSVLTPSTISGALTTTPGSTIRIASDGAAGLVDLIVTNGFTNLGAIELTSTVSTYTAQITVQNGTLLNAPGGTINALPGTGGARTLAAAVDNQGLISLAQPLTWQRAASVHTNSGIIDIAGGNLTLDLNGGASFTNAGTVTIGAGRTLSATGGSFAQNGGTFGGPGDLVLTNATVNGPGTFTNPAGRTVAIRNTTIAAPFVNDGTLSVITTSTISGPLSTAPGSTIRIASDGAAGLVDLIVANGFGNFGTIDLTSTVSTYTSRLTVQNGLLINSTVGTISALPGTGGARILAAEVDNQGLIDIAQTLTWQRPGSAHTNSGTLDVNGGDLVLDLAGGTTFTNAGTVVIGAGRTLTASGGSFAQNGGTFGGPGDLVLTNVTVGGPGTFINAAGRTVAIRNTTIAAPFVNQGTLSVITSSAITGALTTAAGSTIRIASDGAAGLVDLVIANGFTNLGAIDLTSTVSTYTSQLTVTNGTLLNASAGSINALAGTGGPRNILAAIDNQGTIALSPGSASTLNITGNVTTSGTIALDLGGLTVGSLYDRLAVTGTLALGGTLNVGLFGGFVPVSTNAFTVLTSTGATTGTFVTANLAAPLGATPSYGATSVTVAVP